MNAKDMSSCLGSLFTKMRIFCNEADFQHSLAMELEKHYQGQGVDVRLEFPIDPSNSEHFDIMIIAGNTKCPIELKYKTKKKTIKDRFGQVLFTLKNQSAQIIGRYNYLKDIHRIEQYKANNSFCQNGFAILLTNDYLYTKKSSGASEYVNINRGICAGIKRINTNAKWASKYPSFSINNNYQTNWKNILINGINIFYLVVEV